MPLSRNLAAILTALPLLATGCLYDYKNPAELLRAGEASGTVLAERTGPGALEAFPGVSVSLKGSAFDQLTRASGRFALVDLPVGRHTLRFRQGTTWALERDVEIAFGKDGQPEGVDLGKVVLRYASAVEGRVTIPATFTANVLQDGGLAVDEASGQVAVIVPDTPGASTGTYRFPALGVGTHVIKVAVTAFDPVSFFRASYVGGQSVVTVTDADQGTVRTAAPITVGDTFGQGRLRFRVQLVGNPGISLADVTVTISTTNGGVFTSFTVVPDSQGFVDETVGEGLYQVQVTAPAPLGRFSSAPLSLATVSTPGIPVGPPQTFGVVLDGKVAEVGSVYVVSDLVVSFSSAECRVASDCGTDTGGGGQPGTSFKCEASQCFGCFASAGPPVCSPLRPSGGVGGSIPFCGACNPVTQLGTSCDMGPGISSSCQADGFCHEPVGSGGVPCAFPPFTCTTDGVAVFDANSSGC